MNRILEDWLHGHRPRNERKFHARINEQYEKDIYIEIFDSPEDKFPLTMIHIENSDGQLILRVWDDVHDEPIETVDLPSDRDTCPYCLKCGDDWCCHHDDGGCIQDE